MPEQFSEPKSAKIPAVQIDAGEFGAWLAGTGATQNEGADADVPCGSCNGCCKSFYFIHITPEDTAALAAIPHELLFAAPGLPAGHYVMGYNEHGECPMLIDNRCSVYFDRPQTCRAYDCRIFTAAGMEPGETDKEKVAHRTRQWNFSYADESAKNLHRQVQRAARWLHTKAKADLPKDFLPGNSTQLAVLALTLHPLFDATVTEAATATAEFTRQVVARATQSQPTPE